MRFLITGGAGYVGTNLANYLIELGHDVAASDVHGPSKALIQSPFWHSKKLSWWGLCDVKSYEDMEYLVQVTEPDVVIHLAALFRDESPKEMMETNVLGTYNVLKACVENSVPRVINTSSSAVYGNCNRPARETDALNPINALGRSKMAAEIIAKDLAEHIDLITIRPFNIYGPGQDLGVIPSFMRLISQGLPPTIYGNGNHVRDFVFISDALRMFTLAATLKTVHKEVFNLCTAEGTSLNYLAALLNPLYHKDVRPNYQNDQYVSIHWSIGYYDKAFELLKWYPEVTLSEGLRRMIT